MTVKEKLQMDMQGLVENGPINIVIFGDSVSHGIFEPNDTMDYEAVYWNVLRKKLNAYRDFVPVNMINSAIGGTNARLGVQRLERDVLSHHPDLVIVCFGLNDVYEELETYVQSLATIFDACKERDIPVIFMTPNRMATYVTDDVYPPFAEIAKAVSVIQNSGKMDAYMEAGKKTAEEHGALVCDVYSCWKEMAKQGVDTTMLLANRVNHPNREMHRLFAEKLYACILGDDTECRCSAPEENGGMYAGK